MIIFKNTDGTDNGWQADATKNCICVAVYLTKEDKEKIAKMDDNTCVLLNGRPGVPADQRAKWAATIRIFGDKVMKDDFFEMMGLGGLSSK